MIFQHGSCQATFVLIFRLKDEYAMGKFLAKIDRNFAEIRAKKGQEYRFSHNINVPLNNISTFKTYVLLLVRY